MPLLILFQEYPLSFPKDQIEYSISEAGVVVGCASSSEDSELNTGVFEYNKL